MILIAVILLSPGIAWLLVHLWFAPVLRAKDKRIAELKEELLRVTAAYSGLSDYAFSGEQSQQDAGVILSPETIIKIKGAIHAASWLKTWPKT